MRANRIELIRLPDLGRDRPFADGQTTAEPNRVRLWAETAPTMFRRHLGGPAIRRAPQHHPFVPMLFRRSAPTMQKAVAIGWLASLLLAACQAGSQDTPAPVAHQPGAPVPVPTFTATPRPTAKAVPTRTPVPAATPTPVATVEEDAGGPATNRVSNLREGPGTGFPRAGWLEADTPVTPVARNQDGSWLVLADGHWIWAPLVSNVPGNLPVADIIPEPPVQPVASDPVAGTDSSAKPVATPSASAQTPTGGAPLPSGLPFAYGIQAHVIDVGTRNRRQILDAVQDLGFTWLKTQIRWEDFERTPGYYQFTSSRTELDALVADAGRRNIQLLLSVTATPRWARELNDDKFVAGFPKDPAALAGFIGELARRYCGKVAAIEVWNEQNYYVETGDRDMHGSDYLAVLIPASRAIRQHCPGMYIVSGALTPAASITGKSVDDFVYLEQMLEGGLAEHVDAVGAHPHGFNVPPHATWEEACAAIQVTGNGFFNGPCDNPHHSWSFRSTMEGYRELLVRHGAGHLPIVPTEFGWPSFQNSADNIHEAYLYANDNSEAEQAEWTVQAFRMMETWGWTGPAFLWNLNFRVVAPTTERALWGIVSTQWEPLPVYYALRQLTR